MAASFQAGADMLHILTKSIPVESANTMTIVERDHCLIRPAFNIIPKEALDTEQEVALQMAAVKAVNYSVGLDGLVPTLLVLRAVLRLGLPTNRPTSTTFQRVTALCKAAQKCQTFRVEASSRGLHYKKRPQCY